MNLYLEEMRVKMGEVYWDHFTSDYRRFAHTGYLNNKMLLDELLKYLKKTKIKSLADVGCAAGSLYYHLKDMDFKYHGFELSMNSIKAANEIYPEMSITHFDIREDEFSRTFDVVYSSEMLSHIRLVYLWDSIHKLYNAADKLCIFSMKFTIVDSFEFEAKHPIKGFVAPYVNPNIKLVKDFLRNYFDNVHMLAILYSGETTWQFLRDTEYAGKTGNLMVIIDKEHKEKDLKFRLVERTKWLQKMS